MKCDKCNGSGFIYTATLEDSDEILSVNQVLAMRKEAVRIKDGCVPCHHCRGGILKQIKDSKMIRRDKNVVSIDMLEHYANGRKINGQPLIKFAKKIPTESVYLVGETGTLKTMIMEYWYNRIMHDEPDFSSLIWIEELALFKKFRNSESFDGFIDVVGEITKKKYIFLNEVLLPANFRNQDSGGHFNALCYTNYYDLWDRLCHDRGSRIVFASSNSTAKQTLHRDYKPLIRRMEETFAKEIRV